MNDEVIFNRVSCRDFLDQEVEQEKIEKLLAAAMQAPSSMDARPCEFFVVKDQEKKLAMSKGSIYFGQAPKAPVNIVVCYKEGLKGNQFRDVDCAMASQNILLEATSLGLGSIFLGVAPDQNRAKIVELALGIVSPLHVFAIIPIGYAASLKPAESRFDQKKIHWEE
ncbi:MAG: nitroreductase family protein [Bacilli bacterium]|nr:nitroreductase family protein [Bacilli bacterium]